MIKFNNIKTLNIGLLIIGVLVVGLAAFSLYKKRIIGCQEKCSIGDNQCYCSVKCGPRNVGDVAGDNPCLSYPVDQDGKEITTYGKKCFCQQRDQELFIPNECYKK